MEENKPIKSVYSVTSAILARISQSIGTPTGRATLANLRNSIGKPYGGNPEMWSLVYENLPEEFLGVTSRQTYQERAIIAVLQLYALHQQGLSESVNMSDEEGRWHNIGHSLSQLRMNEHASIDRRFNAMITSSTLEEVLHHLRQLIKLLKSKTKATTNAKVNYARLAQDLFSFQLGNHEEMRVRWAKAYYWKNNKGEENEE